MTTHDSPAPRRLPTGRPRKMTPDMIRLASTAMSDHRTNATELARTLGIALSTLYRYVERDGTIRMA